MRYMAAFASQMISTIGLTPLLTRTLGAHQFGVFSANLAFMWVAAWCVNLGLNVGVVRVYNGPDGEARSRAVLIVSLAAGAVLGVAGNLTGSLWIRGFGFSSFGAPEHLAITWAALYGVSMVTLASLRARDRLGVFAAAAFCQSAGAVGAGLIVARLDNRSVTDVFAAATCMQAVALTIGLIALRPSLAPLADRRFVMSTLKFSLPLVPQQLGYFIITGADRLIVQKLLGANATGRYQVVYNVGGVAIVLLTFLNQAWMPRVFANTDFAERQAMLADSRDSLYRLLVPIMIGLGFGAPLALLVWAPGDFHTDQLSMVTSIVIISTVAWCTALASTRVLLAQGKSGRAAIATVLAALVNIGLNFALIPPLGLNGSALATLASYLVLAVCTAALRPQGAQLRRMGTRLMFLVSACVGLVLAIRCIPQHGDLAIAVRCGGSVASLAATAVVLRRLGTVRPATG